MKIAILTQPLHNNYGGILQNYALQQILKKLGHTPVTIDLQYPEPQYGAIKRFFKFFWRLVKRVCGDDSILFIDVKRQWFFMNHPGPEQKSFIATHISRLVMQPPLDGSFCVEYNFDAYVVGSDQVWRPRFSPCLRNYFLDFTQGCPVRRIAYAASFGSGEWEGSEEQRRIAERMLKSFDSISVRENTGLDICRVKFGVDSICSLDPTLLLSVDDYVKLFPANSQIQKPYLAVYVLDMSKAKKKFIESVCHRMELTPMFIGKASRKGYQSVESWLSCLFSSSFVITDSFHGTIFSILSHRPFTVIVNEGRGKDRFTSLLSVLGLENRMKTKLDEPIDTSLIDYYEVDKSLEVMRKDSIKVLSDALCQ